THNWVLASTISSGDVVSNPQIKDITAEPKSILSDVAVHTTAIDEIYGHWMVDYLLTGKNRTEFISLIPGESSLGHVRFKDNLKLFEAPTLVSWLKDIAILEAGHRAVFISGIYASGGGSEPTGKKQEYPQDDIGK